MLLRRLAAEWEERPEGVDRAAEALEQILQISPDEDAFRALARVYRQAKRWLPLAERDARSRRRRTPDARARRRARQGLEDELHDPAEAYARGRGAGRPARADAGRARAAARAARAGRRRPRRWTRAGSRATRGAHRGARAGGGLAPRAGSARPPRRYARALAACPTTWRRSRRSAGSIAARETLRAANTCARREAAPDPSHKARLLTESATLFEDELEDGRAPRAVRAVLVSDPEHLPAAERLVPLARAGVRRARAGARDAARQATAGRGTPRRGAARGPSARPWRGRSSASSTRRRRVRARARAPRRCPCCASRDSAEERQAGAGRELYRGLSTTRRRWPSPSARGLRAPGARETEPGGARRRSPTTGSRSAPSPEPPAPRPSRSCTPTGRPRGAGADKRALLALAPTTRGKARLLEEIGEIYLDKLGNAEGIAAYQRCWRSRPRGARRCTSCWSCSQRAAVGQGRRDAGAPRGSGDGARRARQVPVHGGAHPARRAQRVEGAVVLLNRALDDAPTDAKAFDAIERDADRRRRVEGAGAQLPQDDQAPAGEGPPDLRLRLWSGLGEVSLRQLEDVEMAATALEVAVSLEPENLQRHEKLADLYMQAGPDRKDKAIAEHQWLVARNPDRLASYRALAKLYRDVGAYDKLWCVAATLSFLRKADPTSRSSTRPPAARAARRQAPLQRRHLAQGRAPDEDRFIDAIFMLLGQFVAAAAAQQHQVVGLRRKERVDVAATSACRRACCATSPRRWSSRRPTSSSRRASRRASRSSTCRRRACSRPRSSSARARAAQRRGRARVRYGQAHGVLAARALRALGRPVGARAGRRAARGAGAGRRRHRPRRPQRRGRPPDRSLRRIVPRPVTEQLAAVGRSCCRRAASDRHAGLDGRGRSDRGARGLRARRRSAVGGARDLGGAGDAEPAGRQAAPQGSVAYSVSEDYFAVRKFLGLDVM